MELPWSEVIVRVDPDPTNVDRSKELVGGAALGYGVGGAYVNFTMEGEGEDRIPATYRGNYETGPDNGEIRSK